MTDREILINSLQKGVNLAKDKVRGEGEAFSWGDVADYIIADGFKKVVKCKDCKWCKLCYPAKAIGEEAIDGYYCNMFKQYRLPDNYCSYGELKELNDNC